MNPITSYSGKSVDNAFASGVRGFASGIKDNHFVIGDPWQTLRLTEDSTSPDRGKPMLEYPVLLHIWDPRDRLVYCKGIDIFNMVGLWNYLISGSSSAGFIAYYNPVGRRFVDEEVSSTHLRATWGERLFATGAVDRCISLLRTNPSTRRAIIPVLQSEDVGYSSRNLPCLASIQFAVRSGKLDAFTTMRSQAAIGVLPYDLFLLTMLHEYVAQRAGIQLGEYTHFAPLFGIRETEIPIAQRIMAEYRTGASTAMPEMEYLEPGYKALYLYCEHKIRKEKVWPSEAHDLPGYWFGMLRVTFAKLYGVDWREQILSATDTFPEDFLKKNVDGLAIRARA